MARTPSMTPQQAEEILGPRGQLNVNSENRATARKWLAALGFPALFAAGLSMREIGYAYNDTSGKALESLRRKLAESQENDPDENQEPPLPTPSPVPQIAPMASAAAHGDALQAFRDLLLQGYQLPAAIDENKVRAIVQDQLAGVAPRVIEIKYPDKNAIRIEGLVHPDYERALKYLQGGANVMLVGPAGSGKSHMAHQLATGLDVTDCVISCSAGTSEGEIKGWRLPVNGMQFDYCPSNFVKCYEGGNALICFDEMDGLDPNVGLSVNVPLANGHMYVQQRFENPTVKRGPNVYFMATCNTYGTGANPIYAGRNPLDEATRDRFIFITVDYDKRLEESIAAAGGLSAAEMAGIWELRDRCREAQLHRVISTRAFQKAAVMKLAGDSWREIRDRLLEGWSKDEKAKVGV